MPGKPPKEQIARATEISLEDWFAEISAADAQDEEKGACLVKNPSTGQNFCVQTTAAACKNLKGLWVGGPCGG